MSTLTEIASIAVRTIADRVRDLALTCTAPECGCPLTAQEARVGDWLNLYVAIRKGPVDKTMPLSASELASEARCPQHPLRDNGQPLVMFNIVKTAESMDRWARNNARVADPPAIVRTERAKKPEGAGFFVNATLSKKVTAESKPRPQHRHLGQKGWRKKTTERPANQHKNYGDEGTPAAKPAGTENNTKGKQRQKQQRQGSNGTTAHKGHKQ